jgi:hypothetical protein
MKRRPMLVLRLVVLSLPVLMMGGPGNSHGAQALAAATRRGCRDARLGHAQARGEGLRPPGGLFCTEKDTGNVRLYVNGALQPDPVIHFTVNNENECGLLGIAIDPNFEQNHYIYVYYSCLPGQSCDSSENRVARFVESDGRGSNPTTIFAASAISPQNQHNGGNIHFGPDGKLYISIGDNAYPANSQNVAGLHERYTASILTAACPPTTRTSTGQGRSRRCTRWDCAIALISHSILLYRAGFSLPRTGEPAMMRFILSKRDSTMGGGPTTPVTTPTQPTTPYHRSDHPALGAAPCLRASPYTLATRNPSGATTFSCQLTRSRAGCTTFISTLTGPHLRPSISYRQPPRIWTSRQAPPPIPGSNSRSFPETGKSMTGIFLKYWQEHGGLTKQGLHISEEFTEVSDFDGKLYLVQYFERAVFDYHPENQSPYNVLLSQLGTLQYTEKYNSK